MVNIIKTMCAYLKNTLISDVRLLTRLYSIININFAWLTTNCRDTSLVLSVVYDLNSFRNHRIKHFLKTQQ